MKEFKEIGITVTQFLDETKNDIENVLLENKASWNKSCRDNYNSKNDFASNLRFASTLELDNKVRECAILLNDSKLIANFQLATS